MRSSGLPSTPPSFHSSRHISVGCSCSASWTSSRALLLRVCRWAAHVSFRVVQPNFDLSPQLLTLGLNLLAATYLAPCNRPLYEFIAHACGAELVDGGDWRELARGAIDIAFVCSPPLIWLGDAGQPVAAPVLTDPRFGGKPLYCSEVVVNRDSPFQSLEDLRGTRWAINESSSWSGYWVTLRRIG